jgi:hypothetical protein
MKDALAMTVSLTPTLSQRERVSKVAATFTLNGCAAGFYVTEHGP